MRHKSFILVAVLLLVLVGGAVAAYAYDSSREDVIAEGVTVAGVDVGGMQLAQARRVVARELEEPLSQPIAVVRAKRRFNLSAQDAGVEADVAGMVDEALAKSRDGSIITRVARDLSGGEEDAQVPAQISYDEQAIDDLVARVRKGLDREARDAEVDFPSLEKVKEQKGCAVKAPLLKQRLAQALTVPGAERRVTAPVRITRPKVTQEQLADKYPTLLVADRVNFKLRFYKNLELVKEYTVAVGAVGFDTPAGLYHIQNKAVDPAWSVPELRLGRRPGRHGGPGRRAREPAQGALDGDLRRRRHPRHRPDLLARQRGLARLHPDGDPGRDRALRPGRRRGADLHRLGPDLLDRDLLPAVLLQKGLAAGVSKAERADEDAALALSQDGVPHGRGVARALDRMPGAQRLLVLVDQSGFGQLSARGHATVGGVDEEDPHAAAG